MPKDPSAVTSGAKDHEWWIGESRQFALECSYDRGNRLRRSTNTRLDCRYTGSGTGYEVTAEVLRVNPDLDGDTFVVDPRVGERVVGSLQLFVDYFEYFDRLGQVPGMPALIYTWTIEEIQENSTPGIVVDRDDPRFPIGIPYEGPELIRDLTRESWRTIDRTRIWSDESSYRLRCTLHPGVPSNLMKCGSSTPHGPLSR